LDGEIVCLDERGQSSFRLLQQRFHLVDPARVAQRMKKYPAVLFVFDILYLNHRDVRETPLAERKKLLKKALRCSKTIRWTDSVKERGTSLFNETCKHGGEGIIAKDLSSSYSGGRTGAWLKIKCSGRQEFVIGGFSDPQRS